MTITRFFEILGAIVVVLLILFVIFMAVLLIRWIIRLAASSDQEPTESGSKTETAPISLAFGPAVCRHTLLRLERRETLPWRDKAAVDAQAEALRRCGFADVAPFSIPDRPRFNLLALVKPAAAAYAVVYEHERAGAWVVLSSSYMPGGPLRYIAYSNYAKDVAAPQPEAPWCLKVLEPGASPDTLYRKFDAERPRGEFEEVSAELFPAAWEALWAAQAYLYLEQTGVLKWQHKAAVEARAEALRRLGFADAGLIEFPSVKDFKLLVLVKPKDSAYGMIYDHAVRGTWLVLGSSYKRGGQLRYFTCCDKAVPDADQLARPPWDVAITMDGASPADLYREFLAKRPAGEVEEASAERFALAYRTSMEEHAAWQKSRAKAAGRAARLSGTARASDGASPEVTNRGPSQEKEEAS